ncbi:MAG: peptide ABC transporter substrate-binding protein [Sulfitobacter sp.]|nr:peptide ABC transporter substrate-binding protein [Sulfitobacter sp.]
MSSRRGHIDRRALFSSAAAAALLAATGVGAAGAPQKGGRLRMALSGATRSDSWTDGDGLFMQVARQGMVFETLTEVAADGTLQAELALSWTADRDVRVWTFDLRPGVTFHDGSLFTAEDVVASLSTRLEGEVEAMGAAQVRITLAAPMPSLPLILAQPDFVIRPAHALDAGIGTGLYAVKSFTPGQRLLTQRIARHYKDGRAGWFDEVELTSIPAEEVRGQALRETLVDAADLTDAALLKDLPEVIAQPDRHHPAYALLSQVVQPAQVSHLRLLDNLRGPQRWWFAQS